jgi:hypothetical protein
MFVCAFALAFALVGGTAFAADCTTTLSDSSFVGCDGDQAVGPGSLGDWDSLSSAVSSNVDTVGRADTKFSGGDKELNPGGWDFIAGNTTPKTDLLTGWSSFDGRFLYVGFVREKQNGDTYLSFELNQLAAGPRMSGPNGDIPVPQRSTGDALFTYDISTTNRVSIGHCLWNGDANSGQWMKTDPSTGLATTTAVSASDKHCTPLSVLTTPAAEGGMNFGESIANHLPDYGDTIGAGQFGEAVVDLGALGTNFRTDPCGPNGWFWMHSRASDSVTSQPKDLLPGRPITSPTCDLTQPPGEQPNPGTPDQVTAPDQTVAPDQVQGTTPPPGQLVLGARITPGRARLLGPTGCQARAFRARITGKKIARVIFILDGHKVKTLTRVNFHKTFAIRIDPRRLKIGVHRLVAQVTFQRGSGTKAKQFRLSFQRCPRALRAPRFTG